MGKLVIGIDIGHASIKVTAVQLGGKTHKIVGFNEVSVNPRSLGRDGLADPSDAIRALKQAMAEAKPKRIVGKAAYISVAESTVFRKVLDISKEVSLDDLREVVRNEAASYLPDTLENLQLDYQILPSGDKDSYQILVVAVEKANIDQYLAVLKGAKLQPMAIEPKPSSVARAIIPVDETSPVILVDIGSEQSSISVYADHLIWVTGTITAGGNIIKNPETGVIDEETRSAKAAKLAGMLADEIDHVAKYYVNRARKGAKQPAAIYLTGGGSNIEELKPLLEKTGDWKVRFGEPVIALPEGCDRRYLGALGSALYSTFDQL